MKNAEIYYVIKRMKIRMVTIMKRWKCRILAAVMMALLMCPAAVFACDPITCNAGSLTGYNAGYNAGGVLTFGYDGSRKISFIPGQVTAATGGAHDPIIGAWQTLYNPNQYNFDYVMTAQTATGVWSLTATDPSRTIVGAAAVNTGNAANPPYYLRADAPAAQIDFNTGQITWGPVTGITVNNAIGSTTLSQFASYTTGMMTMCFVATDSVKEWIQTTTSAGTQNGTYTNRLVAGGVSAVPEPSTWALILIGMAFLGYSYRRQWRGETVRNPFNLFA